MCSLLPWPEAHVPGDSYRTICSKGHRPLDLVLWDPSLLPWEKQKVLRRFMLNLHFKGRIEEGTAGAAQGTESSSGGPGSTGERLGMGVLREVRGSPQGRLIMRMTAQD